MSRKVVSATHIVYVRQTKYLGMFRLVMRESIWEINVWYFLVRVLMRGNLFADLIMTS